jgi:hypothetical protein
MQIVRRAYLYIVAFISFQTCLWAAVGLALMVIDPPPPGRLLVIRLAGLLSALIVAIPFYLVHWLIAQRIARDNTDERSASARSLYHYGLMIATAAPALGSGASILHELLSLVIGGPGATTLKDIGDDLPTQLVIVALNAAAWIYARRHALADHQAIPEQGGRATIHRIYRYLFVSSGLALTTSGVGTLLVLILEPGSSSAGYWQDMLAEGLTFLLVGVPLWTVTWLAAQEAFASGGEEAESTLRKGYLYLVSLISCLASISAAATILSRLLQRALGTPTRGAPLMADIASPIAVIIVATVLWIYHGKTLSTDAASLAEGTRQRGLRRLYYYLLGSVGLVASLVGAFGLISVLAAALGGAAFSPLRTNLSNSLASLAAGLPLWLLPWLRMQRNSLRTDELGDEARSSLVRRLYLYIFVFVGVIGSLISGAGLINLLLRWMLGAQPETPLMELVQNAFALILSGATLAYHLLTILGDGKRQRTSRAEALSDFPVALIGPSSWTSELVTVLRRMLPGMPVECGESKQAKGLLAGTKAAVLPSTVLATESALRKQLDAFAGLRVVVPHDQPGWAWAGAAPRESIWKEAQDVSSLLEMAALGDPPSAKRGLGAWGVVGVVLLVMLALFVFLPMLFSLIDFMS